MPLSWSKASNLYFRKIIRSDTGEVSLDADMIRLLLAIDEHRSLSQIARKVDMESATLKRTLLALLKQGLIEPVRRAAPTLDRMFYEALRINLSKAIGPMAEILIEDAAAEAKVPLEKVPVDRAAELIASISHEIPDEDDRILFKKSMIQILNKLTPK